MFRKILFCILLGLPLVVNAQNTLRKKSPEAMNRVRQILDMKVFHDRMIVKDILKSMRDQDASGRTSDPDLLNEMGHEGLFSKKDSDIIRKESARKVVRTRLMKKTWEEQEKEIDEDPFEAFIGLIENQEVPNLKKEELDSLNSVDKTVIPRTLQMLTESGPSVGAEAVSVTYDEVR